MAGARISIEHLWKIRRPSGISLAPDGMRAVCSLATHSMRDNKSTSSLWLLSASGRAPRMLTTCGDKDGQAAWSPDGCSIAFVAKREWRGRMDDEPQIYLIPADGGEARPLTRLATGADAIKWFPDGKRIAFISWVWPSLRGAAAQARRMKQRRESKVKAHCVEHSTYRFWDRWLSDGRVPHLFVVSARGGTGRDLFEGTGYELTRADPDQHCYDISPDGSFIAFGHDVNPEKQIEDEFDIVELDLKSRRFRNLTAGAARRDYHHPRYAPEGARIACLSAAARSIPAAPAEITLIDRARGALRVVSRRWDCSVEAPLRWTPDGSALLCLAQDQARQHLVRFDVASRRPAVLVKGGMVTEFDIASDTVAFVRDDMNTPPTAYAKPGGGAARKIEAFNDALLRGLRFGRAEEVRFPGWRRESTHMWLVYPPGFDPRRKYPVLHSIHGGPHAMSGDSWHFRWNNHLFAAHGYIVADVNYHGSSSFGRRFAQSINGEWGKRELADIEAATALLARRRYVDAKRIFAGGGSYGGYLVAWMNGRVPPGRYRAYVCHAGCFDWVSMIADDGYPTYARYLGAWYWNDPARIDALNPRSLARRMRTPTLVIQGALDYRVPDTQALQYYNTLKARKVPTRLVYFPDENHWILKPQNSRLWYREYFDWLKRFDAPRSR